MASIPELTKLYRHLDCEAAMCADRLRNARHFERDLFVPVYANRDQLLRMLKSLHGQVLALEAPDPVYLLLRTHMLHFIESQEMNTATAFERPSRYISQFTQNVSYLCRKDSRPAQERADILIARLSQAPRVWEGVHEWLAYAPTHYIQEAASACSILEGTVSKEFRFVDSSFALPNGRGSDIAEHVKDAMVQLVAYSRRWKKELDELLEKKEVPQGGVLPDDACIPFEESFYRDLLQTEHGIDLDQLLSWHEEEVEKTRAEVFRIVQRLPISDAEPTTMTGVNDILLKYAGPKAHPDITFREGRRYLDRAKAGSKGYVWLPEDEQCVVMPVPEQIKFSYPWGGYGGGCAQRRPLIGEYFINDVNYQAVTDGWLKMMAIHEAYPGHHVQFIRTTLDRLPETVKMGARSVPITEGTAHRSERVFEFVFEEDPFYPLFVAYRRHHTSVRIKVELMLRYFGRPIGEGVQVYMDELGFDRHIARGQVQAQETMLGYFNCYYYGMKRLRDLEQQSDYTPKKFTEMLFSAGRISVDLFEEYAQFSDEDRARYGSEFASLIQFP